MKTYCVYILTSGRNGTLYIGVTSNLSRCLHEHDSEVLHGFTQKYAVKQLVHVEQFSTMYGAMRREKTLKTWLRSWKLQLIEEHNPTWSDLRGYVGDVS